MDKRIRLSKQRMHLFGTNAGVTKWMLSLFDSSIHFDVLGSIEPSTYDSEWVLQKFSFWSTHSIDIVDLQQYQQLSLYLNG